MFTKVAKRITGQQGLWISVRPNKQAHKGFSKSLAEGQVDLPTQIDGICLGMPWRGGRLMVEAQSSQWLKH